jgi:hypothetical protein
MRAVHHHLTPRVFAKRILGDLVAVAARCTYDAFDRKYADDAKSKK